MNKITIEVDSDIQEAFERASEAEKEEIRSLIAMFFRNSLYSKNLVEVMAEIGTRAKSRGLCRAVEIEEEIKASRDAKDDKFLELAVNGKADFIVTGEADLLVLNPFREIEIMILEVFLASFINSQ